MGPKELADGLIMYLGLVILLTFHEYGHAFAAWKCGDDTARLQGRTAQEFFCKLVEHLN